MININYGIPLNGNVDMGNNVSLSGALTTSSYDLSGNVISNAVTIRVMPIYEGEYIVTPRTTVQYLDTDNKMMTDDVTVLEIPYSEVSNLYGTTISIAS